MKKFIRSIALVLAAVLVFGMTAFAADSPQKNNGGTDLTVENAMFNFFQKVKYSIKVDQGDVEVYPLGPDWLKLAKEYVANHPDKVQGEVLAVVDIRHNGAANVTFTSDLVDANSKVVMLHYVGENWEDMSQYDPEAWDVLSATNNGGIIAFFSAKFSPFALVKGNATGASAVVAPKTGEVIAISAILALIMMAGAVVCAKKARLQK